MTVEELKKHFDEQTYDKNYQDIEVLGKIGYTESYLSWQNILRLNIDFYNKIVCDLGCFHGYFAIQSAKAGAVVLGLDRSSTVLKTATMITELSGLVDKIKYNVWTGGDFIPKCDLIFCLNVLHHFEDQDLAISKMHTDTLFEINVSQLSLVEKYFNVESSAPSHRSGRQIYFCKRK